MQISWAQLSLTAALLIAPDAIALTPLSITDESSRHAQFTYSSYIYSHCICVATSRSERCCGCRGTGMAMHEQTRADVCCTELRGVYLLSNCTMHNRCALKQVPVWL